MMDFRRIVLFFVPLAAFLFYGCSSPEVVSGGGDDFPNSMQVLGARVAENLEKEWNTPSGKINYDDMIKGTGEIMNIPSGLAKRTGAAAADSSHFQITGEFLRVYHRTDSTVVIDTIYYEISGDDTLLVKRCGVKERTKIPLTKERYLFADLDGDGYYENPESDVNRAYVEYLTTAAYGSVLVKAGIDAGPDRSFATDNDNGVLYFSSLVTNARGDTVELKDYRGVGNETAVISGGVVNDSVTVAAREIVTPNGNRLETVSRYIVFPLDSTRSYLIGHSAVEKRLGVRIETKVRTAAGDTLFGPGDTVRMEKVRFPLQTDSVAVDSTVVEALLGEWSGGEYEASMLALHVFTSRRLGRERTFRMSFVSDTPVPLGSKPSEGTLDLTVEYMDEQWQKLQGRVSPGEISALYTDSKGNDRTVTWDRSGRVISD
ncbi:MAG: hypothetical protein ACOCXC_05320 [Fibrobacterota bacterium]